MTAPVPLLLDLWATGLSASNIAAKLGVHPRSVALVIEQARDIGDPRAVIHVGRNGRPIGRPLDEVDPDVEMVPAVHSPYKPRRKCRRGHGLTKKNTIINASGPQCRKCKNLVHQRSRARIKERMECMA